MCIRDSPGGPRIDTLAAQGNGKAIPLPRAYLEEGSLDFSFSGLKSAVINFCHQAEQRKQMFQQADLAASFQQAVVDVLVHKTLLAASQFGIQTLLLAGGVAANSGLRERFTQECQQAGLRLVVPPPILCTDNAAMVACAAYYKYLRGDFAPLTLNAVPGLRLGEVAYEVL